MIDRYNSKKKFVININAHFVAESELISIQMSQKKRVYLNTLKSEKL